MLVFYILVYLTLPIILSRHLTLRQSEMLAESSLREYPQSPKILDFINTHATLLVSLPEPPRYALMLADQQRLVGLGIMEDGPIDVGEAYIARGAVITSQKTRYVSYHSKLTNLGTRVAFWRFGLWREVLSRFCARGKVTAPPN